MRTQVYAALIAVVAAAETAKEKAVADAKKASEATIDADNKDCLGKVVNAANQAKCRWYADSCYKEDNMKKSKNC